MTNAEIKRIAELKERKAREEQARFLIEGKRAIIEALTNGTSIERILINIAVDSSKLAEIYSLAEGCGFPIDEIPATRFNKLVSTGTSQGIVAVAKIASITFDRIVDKIRSKKDTLIIILDRISDPGNLGTILRSASWFGVDAVMIGDGSVDIYNPKVVRSAMSAISNVNVVQEIILIEAITTLKSFGFTIIASSQNGKKNYAFYNFPRRSCLILGSEATGIDKKTLDVCDETVMIPRIGEMESLNVGVAGSIILAEIMQQRMRSLSTHL